MRILMVGDVVGKPGREAILHRLPGLRNELQADFVIVNAENAAGGKGITKEIAESILNRGGADVITLGNHALGQRESFPYLTEEPRILRPHNYPPGVPGRGWGIYESAAGAVGVFVLQGRTFMEPVDDPFRAVDE